MRAIFISYRREDSEGQAGRLFDDLTAHFGEDSVFMDVAGIEPGRDFRRVIDEHVASCGVLLAMIGKRWIDAADQSGRRRLEDPMDFVRLETASALKRDIPVVPVLVHGAGMPRADASREEVTDFFAANADTVMLASSLATLVWLLLPLFATGLVARFRREPADRAESWPLLGLGGVMLFGIPEHKDATGSGAIDPSGIINLAITDVVAEVGDALTVMSDLCLDEFTDHGHCGVLTPDGRVDNDRTRKGAEFISDGCNGFTARNHADLQGIDRKI